MYNINPIWVPSFLLERRNKWLLTTHTTSIWMNKVPGHPEPPKIQKMTKKEQRRWRQQQCLKSNLTLERLRAYHSELDIVDEENGTNEHTDPNWMVKEICGHCKHQDDLFIKVE